MLYQVPPLYYSITRLNRKRSFKPYLLDEPKDMSNPEFFFIFAFLKPKLSLNQSKIAGHLKFGLTVLYCSTPCLLTPWTKLAN